MVRGSARWGEGVVRRCGACGTSVDGSCVTDGHARVCAAMIARAVRRPDRWTRRRRRPGWTPCRRREARVGAAGRVRRGRPCVPGTGASGGSGTRRPPSCGEASPALLDIILVIGISFHNAPQQFSCDTGEGARGKRGGASAHAQSIGSAGAAPALCVAVDAARAIGWDGPGSE